MGLSPFYETGGHATLLEDRTDRPSVKVLYGAALLGLLLSMSVELTGSFHPPGSDDGLMS
jgi:hypothetical protein